MTEPIRQLRRRLDSDPSFRLPATELEWWEPRLLESAVEIAITRASDKQRDFMRAFFERKDEAGRPCDIFVCMGGNRSGKSFACGWLCFALHLRDHAKSGDWFWCVGQNLERSVGGQQQELWKALPRWMFGSQTWDSKIGFGAHRKITLPTRDGGKCLVEFRSADQDPHTFEQAKLSGVWIDERVNEIIYGRLLPRIVDRNGFILYSDIPEQWWQFERLKEADPAAGVYFQHYTMYDNAHNLPEGAIQKVSLRMTADEQKQKVAGEFVVMEGVVYKEYSDQFQPTGHVIEDFKVPADWPRWRLLDYGGSSPTALAWVTISPAEKLYLYREHYERNLSIRKNAEMILTRSRGESYVQNFIDPHAFDRSPANEDNIALQYARLGLEFVPWPHVNVMGEHAMVQRVKYRLERHTLYVFRSCVNARREFRSWKYKCDKDGKPLASDAFQNDHNHLLDGVKGFLGTNPCFSVGAGSIEVAEGLQVEVEQ